MQEGFYGEPESWSGGFYELTLALGEPDDARLDRALRAVWSSERLEGPWARRDRAVGPRLEPGLAALDSSGGGHLHGWAWLRDGVGTVCGTYVTRHVEGLDWLVFYLPLGGLGRVDARVGAYPFADVSTSASWRRPLDTWLRALGDAIHGFEPTDDELRAIDEDTAALALGGALRYRLGMP